MHVGQVVVAVVLRPLRPFCGGGEDHRLALEALRGSDVVEKVSSPAEKAVVVVVVVVEDSLLWPYLSLLLLLIVFVAWSFPYHVF